MQKSRKDKKITNIMQKYNKERRRILQTQDKKAWCLYLHGLPPWIEYEYVQMNVAAAIAT